MSLKRIPESWDLPFGLSVFFLSLIFLTGCDPDNTKSGMSDSQKIKLLLRENADLMRRVEKLELLTQSMSLPAEKPVMPHQITTPLGPGDILALKASIDNLNKTISNQDAGSKINRIRKILEEDRQESRQ